MKILTLISWWMLRTSVDIMRVHEGVRRLRRKSSGSTIKGASSSSAIVEERQTGYKLNAK